MPFSALSPLSLVSATSTSAYNPSLTYILVWFIYPETANVRLEDMNTLFGDATSVMPTPETLAEAESLFGSTRSPVPSLDIHRGHTADGAIPGLDINPPTDKASVSSRARAESSTGQTEQREGLGGWISNMVARARGGDNGESAGYSRVGQQEEDGEEDRGNER
jgi:hypothetical protein